jgi:hypothetical protein
MKEIAKSAQLTSSGGHEPRPDHRFCFVLQRLQLTECTFADEMALSSSGRHVKERPTRRIAPNDGPRLAASPVVFDL